MPFLPILEFRYWVPKFQSHRESDRSGGIHAGKVRGGIELSHGTGRLLDLGLVPVITGDPVLAVQLSGKLLKEGIVVQPLVHAAVDRSASRLRFFINTLHNEEQIRTAIAAVTRLKSELRPSPTDLALADNL